MDVLSALILALAVQLSVTAENGTAQDEIVSGLSKIQSELERLKDAVKASCGAVVTPNVAGSCLEESGMETASEVDATVEPGQKEVDRKPRKADFRKFWKGRSWR